MQERVLAVSICIAAWQVLGAMRAAAELVPTLDQFEAGFRRYIATRRPEGAFAEFLPFASDQVSDWEAAAASNGIAADTSEVRHLAGCLPQHCENNCSSCTGPAEHAVLRLQPVDGVPSRPMSATQHPGCSDDV